jgi:hypothetical protein
MKLFKHLTNKKIKRARLNLAFDGALQPQRRTVQRVNFKQALCTQIGLFALQYNFFPPESSGRQEDKN